MIEGALLILAAALFGLMFERSGLWPRTVATAQDLKTVVAPFRVSGSGDAAREAAARRATGLLARYALITIPGLVLLVLLSSLHLLVAVWLGWTSTAALWRASWDPVVLVLALVVWLATLRW